MHGGLEPRKAALKLRDFGISRTEELPRETVFVVVVVVFFGSQGPAKASQAAYYKQKGGYFV
jgi:hypothetical protein